MEVYGKTITGLGRDFIKDKIRTVLFTGKVNFRNNNRKTVKFKDLIVRKCGNIN